VIELSEVSGGPFFVSVIGYPNGTFKESLRYVLLSSLWEEIGFKYEG